MAMFTETNQYANRGAALLTDDVIWEAVDSLAKERIPIGVRAVQEKLGVRDIRGSARTIGKSIQGWIDENTTLGEITPMPKAVRSALWYWVLAKSEGGQAKAEWRKVRRALDEWVQQEVERREAVEQGIEDALASIEEEARKLAA